MLLMFEAEEIFVYGLPLYFFIVTVTKDFFTPMLKKSITPTLPVLKPLITTMKSCQRKKAS